MKRFHCSTVEFWKSTNLFRATTTILGFSLFGFLVVFGAPTPQPAPPRVIKLPTKRIATPAGLRRVTRPPIPFVPIEMKDPRTGRTFVATDQVTLRNGKRLPAGDYIAKLNKIEKALNSIGHTLRKSMPFEQLKAANFRQNTVATFDFDRSKLTRGAGYPVSAPHSPPQTALNGVRSSLPAFTVASGNVPRGGRTEYNNLSYTHSFSGDWGDRGLLAIGERVEGALTGNPNGQLRSVFKRDVYGSLFGVEQSILSFSSDLTTQRGGRAHKRITATSLGQSVFSQDVDVADPTQGRFIHPATIADWSVQFNYPLADLLSVDVTLGAKGSVTAAGSNALWTAPAEYSDTVLLADVRVYGDAKVDIEVAWGGVRADVLLLQDQLTQPGLASMTSPAGYWWHDEGVYQKMTALKGRIYAYVCFDPLPFLDASCYDIDLFDFDSGIVLADTALWNPEYGDLPLSRGPR